MQRTSETKPDQAVLSVDRLRVAGSLGDCVRATGLYSLDPTSSFDAVEAVLGELGALVGELQGDGADLVRDEAVKVLKAAGRPRPGKLVNTFLGPRPPPNDEGEGAEELGPEELAELYEAGRVVLEADDRGALLRGDLRFLAFAGDTSAVELLDLAFGSRFLSRPINVAVEGPSSAGKSYAVEAALRFHPPEAAHLLTASSERALAYTDFNTEHAYVVVAEAAGLHRDGIGATIIRELAWGRGLRYEVVEKTPEGLRARLIEKPGPTGLITTTTRRLDPEVSTRMLRIQVTDSPRQTRAIVDSQAGIAQDGSPAEPDLAHWHAAIRWLGFTGSREVVVPFAKNVAERVPVEDVRMRRDFTQIMTVVAVSAFLHQQTRDRDAAGRVVADRMDYETAYRLLATVMAVTLDAVTDETRETVGAVERLTLDQVGGISFVELGSQLGLSTSGAWRRANIALGDNYLINNENRNGYPARLVLGDPLPASRPVLPAPEQVFPHRTPPTTAQRLNASPERGSTTPKRTIARGVDSPEALSQRLEARNSSRNGPFPRSSAEKPEAVEALSASVGGNERGLLNADVDRAWDAAWKLDELCGDHAATSYVAATVVDGNRATIAALADELEAQIRQEQMVP